MPRSSGFRRPLSNSGRPPAAAGKILTPAASTPSRAFPPSFPSKFPDSPPMDIAKFAGCSALAKMSETRKSSRHLKRVLKTYAPLRWSLETPCNLRAPVVSNIPGSCALESGGSPEGALQSDRDSPRGEGDDREGPRRPWVEPRGEHGGPSSSEEPSRDDMQTSEIAFTDGVLKSVARALGIGVFVSDAGGTILWVNDVITREFGKVIFTGCSAEASLREVTTSNRQLLPDPIAELLSRGIFGKPISEGSLRTRLLPGGELRTY